ncbi:MAG TPA: YtxH domain-containing protein [Spirochaetia bacterium]|nr:MAG: hypothetical protein A2Y41_01285 [Spirochaetes bacterium GWB1_36_13]HCL56585.1 YtxH domain-containing protein [Spirochaetia bacterium]
MDRDTVSKVGLFTGGVALGVLLGILFAPASGRETREKIKDNYKALEAKTKEKLEEIKEMAKTQIEKIRGKKKEEEA